MAVEPRLGDLVIVLGWPRGRIEVIDEYQDEKVVGVKFEGSFLKQFYHMNQLEWCDDHWRLKE
jgi:hypothetical protein